MTGRRGTVVETESGIAVEPEQPTRRLRVVARWVAITAIEIVIAIHVLLTPMHLRETLYVGVLFIIGNALLLLALLLMTGPRHELAGWSLAAAVCAGEFVGFVLSRTTGLPLGYHETWASAPEDYLGLLSLACDVVFGAAAVAWMRARAGVSPPGGRTGTA